MKYKYKLVILTGGGFTQTKEFIADSCSTTSNGSSSGYYAFFSDKKLISCYPIERTVIESIEEIEKNG